MRELPARLPLPPAPRGGGPWREAAFFLIAFLAVFGGAFLGLDLLAGAVG